MNKNLFYKEELDNQQLPYEELNNKQLSYEELNNKQLSYEELNNKQLPYEDYEELNKFKPSSFNEQLSKQQLNLKLSAPLLYYMYMSNKGNVSQQTNRNGILNENNNSDIKDQTTTYINEHELIFDNPEEEKQLNDELEHFLQLDK